MTERIRGRRLQRIRAAWLKQYPLCVMCEAQGRVTDAKELDHIIALDNGGPDFDVDEGLNRQGLCEPCHEIKTNIDLGHKPRIVTGIDGWPVEEQDRRPRWRRAEGRGG